MVREAIGTGTDIQEAQEAACKELGVETHEAEFEIVQMPEKKKFGLFGGAPAKVRAFINIKPAQVAADYLKDVLTHMGASGVEVGIEETEGGAVFNLTGDDIGFVIGHRGETLDALQYLTGLVANHVENSYYRVTINTGNYREKREKTLEVLARKMAQKATKTRRNCALEPMNPYERRIIHTTVQKMNGAISWSEGENTNRHVVIGPDPSVKPVRSNTGYRKEGGYQNRPPRRPYGDKPAFDRPRAEAPAFSGSSAPVKKEAAKSFSTYDKVVPGESGTAASAPSVAKETPVSREPKKEAPVSPLYGKIEPKN